MQLLLAANCHLSHVSSLHFLLLHVFRSTYPGIFKWIFKIPNISQMNIFTDMYSEIFVFYCQPIDPDSAYTSERELQPGPPKKRKEETT